MTFKICYTTVQSRCLHSLFTPHYVIYSKWGGKSCSIMWCFKKLLQEHCNHYMCSNHLSCRLLCRELFDCRNTLVCGLPLLLRLCISIELHNDSVFRSQLFILWSFMMYNTCIFLYFHRLCPEVGQKSLAEMLALISCHWLDKYEHEYSWTVQ